MDGVLERLCREEEELYETVAVRTVEAVRCDLCNNGHTIAAEPNLVLHVAVEEGDARVVHLSSLLRAGELCVLSAPPLFCEVRRPHCDALRARLCVRGVAWRGVACVRRFRGV